MCFWPEFGNTFRCGWHYFSLFEWLPNEVAFLADRKVTINLEIQTQDDLHNH